MSNCNVEVEGWSEEEYWNIEAYDWAINADRAKWREDVEFAIMAKHVVPYSDSYLWVTGFNAVEYSLKDGVYPKDTEPLLVLNKSRVQYLFDALWRIGFRPSSGDGNEGALSATKSHLEDMRRLVFEGGKRGQS